MSARAALPVVLGAGLVAFGIWAALGRRATPPPETTEVETPIPDGPSAPPSLVPAPPDHDADEAVADAGVEFVEGADGDVEPASVRVRQVQVTGLASMAVRPGQPQVAVGGFDGSVHLVRLHDGAVVRELLPKHAQTRHATSLAWADDGERLLVGRSGEEWEIVSADGRPVDGPWFEHMCGAVLSAEGLTLVGDCVGSNTPLPSRRILVNYERTPNAIARDGSRVVLETRRGLELHDPVPWDGGVRSHRATAPVRMAYGAELGITPNGATVVAADDASVLLWWPDAGRARVARRSSRGVPRFVAVSADARRAAVGFQDLEVWDLRTLRRVLRIAPPASVVRRAELTDDAAWLVCLTKNESVFAVDLEAELAK